METKTTEVEKKDFSPRMNERAVGVKQCLDYQRSQAQKTAAGVHKNETHHQLHTHTGHSRSPAAF